MSAAVNAAKQAITKYAAPVAEQGSKYAGIAVKEGTTRYEKLMADNAQYILKDPAAADPLLKQWFFTKMSTIPKRYAHAGEELEMVKAKWAKRSDLHMSEVGFAALFGLEVFAWFSVGEIIGRGGSITGYFP